MRIELNCAECGGNRFTLSRFDDDETEIECVDCGHKIGTMAQLKSRLADEVSALQMLPIDVNSRCP